MHTYIENILSKVKTKGQEGHGPLRISVYGEFYTFLMYDPRTPINQKLTIMSHKILSK